MNIEGIVESVSGIRVLLLGDIMLDRYWFGDANRISPEAPVPVVGLKSEKLAAGGAANVAGNLVGLGAAVTLCGMVGDDEGGRLLLSCLESSGIPTSGLLVSDRRPTTVKTRVVASHQQVVRVDREESGPLIGADYGTLNDRLEELIGLHDIVLLSDYAKGFLSPEFVRRVIDLAASARRRVIVDPKGRDYSKYHGASVLTPNNREAVEATGASGDDEQSLISGGRTLISELGLEALLITRGEHGMLLLEGGGTEHRLAATARDVFDVTGAGDTVIAALTAAIASGVSLPDAAAFANLSAGIVVEHFGTTSISKEMLLGGGRR